MTEPVEGLETTAEARAYLVDYFDNLPPEERDDTWTARFVGRALLRDHATLTARLAAAEEQVIQTNGINNDYLHRAGEAEARLAAARDAMCELDGHYQKALAGWDAERTVREALEAALRVAGLMSNILYNVAQQSYVPENVRHSMIRTRQEWDTARALISPSGNGEGT